MSDLIASGRIVDVILALVAIEFAVLVAYRRITLRGIAALDMVFNLLAGACLLMALRSALSGSGWAWIAAWLFAALVAHLADLARRWRR
jgi:hypothetical protein